ncbi:MAG: AI-2E family transporter [Pseudomonadales bacterium]|nr:AI-2E family transporter [Pseudomonadales bacterium]
MFDVVRSWIDRFLSEEEAVLLAAILISCTIVILTMGKILAPLLTGIVIAYVMQGAIKAFERLHFPKGLAVWCTFLMFMGGFVALLLVVIPRVWRQMRLLFDNLPAMVQEAQGLLHELPAKYPQFVSEQIAVSWGDLLNEQVGDIGQWLVSVSISQLPLIVTVAVYTMLIPIVVFFLLKDQDEIVNWFKLRLPAHRPLLNRIGHEMNIQMSNYIRGKVIEIIIVGGASYVIFKIFGLNYAALLAFLVGLSVIVPYVGFVAVTFPVVIIAYLQFGWSPDLLWLLGWYFALQSLDGLVIVPLLFSEAVNLHPVAIITAILVFGSWWGLWGVFFAIPLATLVKSVMSSWPRGENEEGAGAG